jgi:hypothetical protein
MSVLLNFQEKGGDFENLVSWVGTVGEMQPPAIQSSGDLWVTATVSGSLQQQGFTLTIPSPDTAHLGMCFKCRYILNRPGSFDTCSTEATVPKEVEIVTPTTVPNATLKSDLATTTKNHSRVSGTCV